MKLTNEQIYIIAQNLFIAFNESTLTLPVKINFALIKNKKILLELAQEIDLLRENIVAKYGTQSEDNQYVISADQKDTAVQELNELFALEQEVDIYKIHLTEFKDEDVLTMAQMEALMFMIEEE